MTATANFAFRTTNYEASNPVASGAPQITLQQYRDWLLSVVSGSAGQPTTTLAGYNQATATGTLVDNGLTGGDVAGATINGVDATATYASSVNNTITLIKNKINNGGNTPNDLITLAAYAKRNLVQASAYFTLNSASGTLAPEVDGNAVSFTATGDDAVDAGLLADAINADAAAGLIVFAYSDGVDKCYVTAAGTNRATLTISSGAGAVGAYINGILKTVTWATSDAATATALTAAINADTRLNRTVRAVNSSSGVVAVISLEEGDQMPAIGGRGTGLTVGGTTTPSTTLTISTGSGTLTCYINGVPAASVTATGTDATDAANLAAAINASTFARRYVVATSAAGVVTVTSTSGISLAAVGSGCTASAGYLTGAGTYGGDAGNAITLTSDTGVTRSAATLSAGLTTLVVTSTQPGVAGNWITFAAGGAAAAHLTASGARLGASPSGLVVAGAETVQLCAFS